MVIGGKKEENFLLKAALLHVWNYSEFQYALAISRTWVCWGVVFNDFKTVWISFLVRLLMIRILMQHFQTVSSAYTYSKKPAPKSNRFLNMLWLTLKWTLDSTGLWLVVDVLLSHQSGVSIEMKDSEAAVQRCSVKRVFLEISQNSQENTCARVSFLIKLQAEACNFIKKETLAQVSSCEFCKISKNTFFIEHLRATASVSFNKATEML